MARWLVMKDADGFNMAINLDQAVAVKSAGQYKHDESRIRVRDGTIYDVKHSVDDVLKMIAESVSVK